MHLFEDKPYLRLILLLKLWLLFFTTHAANFMDLQFQIKLIFYPFL